MTPLRQTIARTVPWSATRTATAFHRAAPRSTSGIPCAPRPTGTRQIQQLFRREVEALMEGVRLPQEGNMPIERLEVLSGWKRTE